MVRSLTLRQPRRILLALAVASMVVTAGMAGTASANGTSSPTTAAGSLGPVIDPDQQIAEFRASAAQSSGRLAGAPDAGRKAGSAATNLAAYPKFADAQLADRAARERKGAAQSSSARDGAEVLTVERSPAGIQVSIYTPAPSVTPEALADMLRKQGKNDVRLVRHGTMGVQQANDCAYGQARSFTCPVSFWTNNGYADPIVRFNDHSGAAWPTDNAVYKWNQVPNIDSWYRWNSCPYMAGARCVDVFSGNYGAGWVGRANMRWVTPYSGPFQEQGNSVQLNDYYAPVGFTRNNVVTHELGHVLGLGHNLWSGDVMYQYVNMREDIGGENPVLLASIYSIYR